MGDRRFCVFSFLAETPVTHFGSRISMNFRASLGDTQMREWVDVGSIWFHFWFHFWNIPGARMGDNYFSMNPRKTSAKTIPK